MDILTLLEKSTNEVGMLLSNPLTSFGAPEDPFLGLSLLMPERSVEENQFTETRISYKTFAAL